MPVTVYTGVTQLRGVSSYAATSTGTAPTITSNGGGSTAAVSVNTGDTDVTTVTATGTAPVTFYIQGGANASLFQIDAATGALSFKDTSIDGAYVVIVGATNLWGTDTQKITATVAGVYHASAVHFDGTAQLVIPSLTATDGTGISLSLWLKVRVADLTKNMFMWVIDPDNFGTLPQMNNSLAQTLGFLASNTDGSNYIAADQLVVQSVDNIWLNFLASADTNHVHSSIVMQGYINDDSTSYAVDGGTGGPFNIAMSGKSFELPSLASLSFVTPFIGDMADVLVWPSFIDWSVQANRRNLIDAMGKPVDPAVAVAAFGSPLIYASGNAAAFVTNQGTGGAFSLTGSITNSASSPSD